MLRYAVAGLLLLLCTGVSATAQRDTTDSSDSLDTGIRIGRGGVGLQLGFRLPNQLQLLRLTAGYSMPSVDAAPSLSPALALELDFGNLTSRRFRHATSVAELDATTIRVAALSPAVAFGDSSRVALEGWRFGFQLSSGHHLGEGSSGVYLLHSGGWTWSYVRPSTAPRNADSMTTAVALATADSYRTSHFGANTCATIGYSIGGTVTIEASYQRVLLYKNHVFFPWLGSLLLEGLAQSALSAALVGAQQRNPSAAAIATLVLRSALSWGIYQLRSTSGQHFPFKGNTPLLWDELRIGIGMQF